MKLIKTYFSYLGIAYFVGSPLYYIIGVTDVWLWPFFSILALAATYFHYYPICRSVR